VNGCEGRDGLVVKTLAGAKQEAAVKRGKEKEGLPGGILGNMGETCPDKKKNYNPTEGNLN